MSNSMWFIYRVLCNGLDSINEGSLLYQPVIIMVLCSGFYELIDKEETIWIK